MENNLNGSSNLGNLTYTGNQFQLPPRSPIHFNFPPHFSPVVRTDGFPNPPTHEFQVYHHQRTSSDSILQEEQPSWLEDLLDEPDTETQGLRGHRRSFSDSFTYFDAKAPQNRECGFKDIINAGTPNECQKHEHYHEQVSHALLHNTNPCKPSDMNEFWESSPISAVTYTNGFIPTNDCSMTLQTSEPSCSSKKSDSIAKADQEEPFVSTTVGSDCSQINNPPANNKDSKRSKQQTTHGSRVRKLRYIVQLERHLQALQARGSEASAELEFLDQYNLILGMENSALKYRLDTLQQQQLIKQMEHEMLEREVARLRNLYQQQQQQQQQLQQQQSARRRSKTRDLDCQHANLFVVRH